MLGRLGRPARLRYTERRSAIPPPFPRPAGGPAHAMNRVTTVCFLASYSLALGLELLHLRLGGAALRALALLAGAAGLVAHTLYLIAQQPPLVWQFSWMLFVAWVLAVFYLEGALHHRRLSWGVFVLPLILGLLGLGLLFGRPPADARGLWQEELLSPSRLWGPVHAVLILLATVGVCIGFLASLMYLIQAHRLRTKAPPGQGLRLLSLERLEAMNRRAIVLAFPLLTAGVLAGVVLIVQGSDTVGWTDPRVLGTAALWVVFALLLYLRFAQHLRGRRAALLTIAAFVLLLCCLAISHPLPQGG
jgi:ABC-type transport system involved in cytochrome c biogenesis permease subunit